MAAVFLTGADGYIGSHITAALLARGHRVIGAVRRIDRFRRRFPAAEAVAADLERMTDPADWRSHLAGIDAVVNAAGILQAGPGQGTDAVHDAAPRALFKAAADAGIGRVIQLSAISIDADTDYARTKRAADEALLSLPQLRPVVLRPSFVYGGGAHGGSAMLRAVAAMPFRLPLPGGGGQAFTPIHVADLARLIADLVDDGREGVVMPVGPQTMTLAGIVQTYRGWLGLPPVPVLPLPMPMVRRAARIGDLLDGGPLSSTGIAQLEHGNAGDPAAFAAFAGFGPRPMAEALQAEPAGAAELWHARLWLLRPVIRAALILLWLGSGIAGMLAPAGFAAAQLAPLGLAGLAGPLGFLFSLLDLVIALLLTTRPRLRGLAAVQLAIVGGYSIILGLGNPGLWLDPYGAFLKNLPVLALILVWAAIRHDRE